MASYGYRSNHINDIRNNLRDRYKSGFPILKELIQNADDAKARRLVFGMHPGFQGKASHSLLQGPGFWVFNDGEFNKEDEGAIRSIGLNSKAGESGSIGKFGLGLKSVHHLCEAFFYVAFDGHQHFDVLLNPWRNVDGTDQFHGAWDHDDVRDYDALRSIIATEQLDNGKAWFLMWIPLRQWAHVRKKDGKPYGGIVDKYPGNDISNGIHDLLGENLIRKIRSIVPLLRNLESIELAANGQTVGFKVQISFDDGVQRVDHRSTELISAGSVSAGGGSKGKLQFRIHQRALPGQSPFCQFKQLEVWPKTESSNSDGDIKTVPDKSEAEGAVMVSRAAADGDEAKLSIDWAVFLPMEEGLSYEYRLDKSLQRYQIVLHGQFFVDAGRRGIAGYRHLADSLIAPSRDLDDADLHTGWNQSVAQKVILPQLLPALAQFANDLNDSEKEELTRAIRFARTKSSATGIDKEFWENFRDFVCHEQAWVRLVTSDGLKWSHVKVTQDSRLLMLPRPPRDDPQRPWKVLPRLKKLVDEGCLLIDEEAPSLMRTHSDWDAATLLKILDGVDFEEACSETGMVYLVRFLSIEQRRYVNGSDVQRKLVEMVRTMLKREPIQTFRSIRSTFQELTSLVKPEYRIAVGTKRVDTITGLDDTTLKLLINADVAKVLLPMDLDPDKDDTSKGQPDEEEISNLLKTIDREISRLSTLDQREPTKQVENLLRAAQSILALLSDKKDERGQAIRVNRSLRVLTATCARTQKSMAASFDELQSAHQSGLLFKRGFGAGPAAYPVAVELAKLLPAEHIWVVDPEIADWVQPGEQNGLSVPPANDSTAAYLTLGKPGRSLVLADLTVRSRFVRNISPAAMKGDDVMRGMRYVLHGSEMHHDNLDATLWINADPADEVWIKLKCMIEPDSWNVVDCNLAGAIKSDDWEKLGIRKVGSNEIIKHMREECNFDRIDAGKFSESEIVKILTSIADEKLWQSIPLHRDSMGKFGPIGEACFFDPDRIANPLLLDGVRIIDHGDDQKLCELQSSWIPRWTHETTIEQALTLANPETHWALILEAVGKVKSADRLEKIDALKSTSWLPLAANGTICPEDVIDLEPLAADIDRLASECAYCYAGVSALSQEVQQHSSFSKIKPLFSTGKSALERLGQLMVDAGDHLIGDISLPVKLESLLEPLAGLSALPAWAIVKSAIDAVGSDHIVDVTECLIKEIRQPLSKVKLIEVLNEISARDSREQHAVFNLYLKQLAQRQDDLPAALSKIQLLARDGSWKSASMLCVDVQGVVKGSVLHDEQALILAAFLDRKLGKQAGHGDQNASASMPDDASVLSANEKAQAILVNYFKPWREFMPSGPIGALFALLGPSFRSLAVEWLKPHSFEYFSDELGWNEPQGDRSDPVWDYKNHYPKLAALDMLDFTPEISNSKEIEVVSLLGTALRVPVDSAFDGLIMGNLTWAGTGGNRSIFRMRLRELPNPERHEHTALSNMLRKTCECILREAYNQREPNLGQLWATLEKSNQLELAVARRLILDSLPYDLRKLKSVKKNPELSQWLSKFKKLETSRAERIEAKQSTAEIEKELADAKTELSRLMTSDTKVQESVLNGIRQRVEENQYKVSSVAFELFQNADDAVIELQVLMRDESTPAHSTRQVGRFVMETTGDTVRFMHWGRPINYMGHGKSSNESYGEDLQRMLILAASDKDDTTGLTGKFGLGFKSVLLATDAPCILSGDLKTKIVGGCLPMQWPDAREASDALQHHRLPDAPALRGTVVEFKVNAVEKQSQVRGRFSALAGLQCVFSREIRSIQIDEMSHQWLLKPLADDLQNVEIGEVHLPSKGGLSSSHLLNFRMAEGCFALKVDPRGFVRFQDDVEHFPPGIWVTAPTREPAAHGLILNSQFQLDTGRGGLPRGEGSLPNLDRAEAWGVVAATLVLQATRQTRNNWDQARSQLKLATDVTPPEFWATFWGQIPTRENDQDDGEADRLLSRFGNRLYSQFVRISKEIPNGLAGSKSAFVKASSVCLTLNARWEKLYESLSKWTEFIERFPVSGWVSESVATQLKSIAGDGDQQPLDVSVEVLLDTVPQGRCSSNLSATLAGLLKELSPQEGDLVKVRMADFQFQAKDGSWKRGSKLLKSGVDFDALCLPFAPAMCILHPSYEGLGLALVRQYTVFQRPHVAEVAPWILDALNDDARIGGLRYLLSAPEVRQYFSDRIAGTWLDELELDSPYLNSFSGQDKNLLMAMFSPSPIFDFSNEGDTSPDGLQGDEALAAIRDWWKEDGIERLIAFDREFWPAEIPRQFDSICDNRLSWMTLFGIGLMQRHGRVRDQQNRGFIDMMQSKGWWDVFSNVDPRADGQAWLDVLREYGKPQIQDEKYSMWMDNFPRLYRIASWFDVYTQVFLGLDYRDKAQIAEYLSPSADPVMTGSGIHAPTMRGSLRLGQHVVVRELLRCGVLKSDAATALAYKPGSSVKGLLSSIGFDLGGDEVRSEQVYEVLLESLGDDATFDGAYDIPLIIFSRDAELRRRILGATVSDEDEFDDV